MALEPLSAKWVSFGWNVLEINGHDSIAIEGAFMDAQSCVDRPTIILANTIKGKGVSFMENSPRWHGSVKINDQDFVDALKELGASSVEIKCALHG